MPDEEAEDVGLLGQVARARAQADRLDRHGRERAEALGHGRQDRRAGGRGQLHLDRRLGERDALEQLGRAGRGQGHPAVGRLDPAPAGRHRAGLEPLDAQQVEPDRRADDVDDRVDRADLVEMDLRRGRSPWTVASASPSLQEDPLGQVVLPRASGCSCR